MTYEDQLLETCFINQYTHSLRTRKKNLKIWSKRSMSRHNGSPCVANPRENDITKSRGFFTSYCRTARSGLPSSRTARSGLPSSRTDRSGIPSSRTARSALPSRESTQHVVLPGLHYPVESRPNMSYCPVWTTQ